jgi:hypothetical protein
VHRYTRRPVRPDDRPDLVDARFTSAPDVARFAALHPGIGRVTWADTWHLDHDGRVTCCGNSGPFTSVLDLAEDPMPLLQSRLAGVAEGGCGADWVIVESRPAWLWDGRPEPGDPDELAFTVLRDDLAEVGVTLLDCVVFDDDGHWWSLREATGGGLAWPQRRR